MRLNTFCSFTYKVNKMNHILNYVGLVCVFLSRMVIFKGETLEYIIVKYKI